MNMIQHVAFHKEMFSSFMLALMCILATVATG
jgi:hypothetical protein